MVDLKGQNVSQEVLQDLKIKFEKVERAKLKGFKIYDVKKEFSILDKKKVTNTITNTHFITAKDQIKRRSRVDLKRLINYINGVLPSTIADNMGTPALNYRTGRFAQSASVVGSNITPKGFISLSFTYQKNPYSIFELNGAGSSKLATFERDPVNIISKSIREIASGIIEGDFYLKRV